MKMKPFLVLVGFAIFGVNAGDLEKSDGIIEDIMDGIMAAINDMGDDGWTMDYLVKSNGYHVETHQIITSDGYILTLHRIPYGKTDAYTGKVAFLQHGLLSSSADWLVTGAEKGLGFLLADAGYDVWLGNARGNTYSRNHTTMSYNDEKFWDFTWHEIGLIDVPEMIDYILEVTGVDGIYYAGHSQGTTVYYVMNSCLPQYNKKIKVAAHLSPVAYMSHMTSPLLRFIATWAEPIELLTDMIGLDEFMPNSDFIKYMVGDVICNDDSVSEYLCMNSLFALCGFNRKEMNTSIMPLLAKYSPAGSSTKQILHYAQGVNSGRFRQYDFGIFGNVEKYGRLSPPSYDLSKITAPTYLYWSRNDWLSHETDVNKLCADMKNGCKKMILVADKDFNHIDYLFGINAPHYVYYPIRDLFNNWC